jgi:chromosome segregation ATPase
MHMSFLNNFLIQKVQSATDTLTQHAIAADPQAAAAASKQTLLDGISALNHRIAELQATIDVANKKIIAEHADIEQHMKAAEILAGSGKPDGDSKAQAVLDDVESLNSRLTADQEDLASAQQTIGDMTRRRDELTTQLRTISGRIEEAARDLERANLQKEHAKDVEAQAKHDAGLTRDLSGFDVAAAALDAAAKKARVEAETAMLNAKTVAGMSATSTSQDADVAAALAAARGAPPAGMSVAERLAAMRAK